MEALTSDHIHAFLNEVGSRYPKQATLTLLGGSALCLLGSERPTLDIDYVGDDLRKNELQQLIDRIADELHIVIDAVPIEQFVPVPDGAAQRQVLIGQFGQITAYVLDPYTIALSKLDRGFDTDIDDILFLIRRNLITIDQLEETMNKALQRASEFGLDSQSVRTHLQAIRNSL
jgi:hypothetical protein